MISLLFLVTQIYCAPYATQALNNTQSCAVFVNVLTLFVGIMLIIDYELENAAVKAGTSYDLSGRSAISVVIFVINLAVLAVPLMIFGRQVGAFDKIFALCTGKSEILSNAEQLQSYVDKNIQDSEPEEVWPPKIGVQLVYSTTPVSVEMSQKNLQELSSPHSQPCPALGFKRWPHWPDLYLPWQADLTSEYDNIYRWQPGQWPQLEGENVLPEPERSSLSKSEETVE